MEYHIIYVSRQAEKAPVYMGSNGEVNKGRRGYTGIIYVMCIQSYSM